MRLKMNLGEDENFAFKHPYFFDNSTFKFEGLKPAIQKGFENATKSMGATVSEDAKHVFTDIKSFFSLDQKKNYYSISYLSESIFAEKPLEIENFKFTDLVQSSNQSKICCPQGRYFFRQSCISYITQNKCCKLCMEKIIALDKLLRNCNEQVIGDIEDPNVGNLNEASQHSNIDTLNEEINGLQIEKSMEIMNNPSIEHFETNDINLDENSNDSTVQPLSNEVPQENEFSKNNSDSSDIEMVEIRTNNDLEKASTSKQGSHNSKAKGKSTIDRWKKNRIISSDSDTSSESDYLSCLKKRSNIFKTNKTSTTNKHRKIRKISSGSDTSTTTKHKKIRKIPSGSNTSTTNKHKRIRKMSSGSDTSSKSQDTRKLTRKPTNKRLRLSSSPPSGKVTNESSDFELIDEAEGSSSRSSSNNEQGFVTRDNPNKKEWWLNLCSPKEYTAYGTSRKRDYDITEKRLMITYLVTNDLIDDGTSRKPWQKLLDDGYLKHRTVESLNNHYRKTLLPTIESYKLPADIEKQFVDCRKLHIGRK